jgi:hypothetical protein
VAQPYQQPQQPEVSQQPDISQSYQQPEPPVDPQQPDISQSYQQSQPSYQLPQNFSVEQPYQQPRQPAMPPQPQFYGQPQPQLAQQQFYGQPQPPTLTQPPAKKKMSVGATIGIAVLAVAVIVALVFLVLKLTGSPANPEDPNNPSSPGTSAPVPPTETSQATTSAPVSTPPVMPTDLPEGELFGDPAYGFVTLPEGSNWTRWVELTFAESPDLMTAYGGRYNIDDGTIINLARYAPPLDDPSVFSLLRESLRADYASCEVSDLILDGHEAIKVNCVGNGLHSYWISGGYFMTIEHETNLDQWAPIALTWRLNA